MPENNPTTQVEEIISQYETGKLSATEAGERITNLPRPNHNWNNLLQPTIKKDMARFMKLALTCGNGMIEIALLNEDHELQTQAWNIVANTLKEWEANPPTTAEEQENRKYTKQRISEAAATQYQQIPEHCIESIGKLTRSFTQHNLVEHWVRTSSLRETHRKWLDAYKPSGKDHVIKQAYQNKNIPELICLATWKPEWITKLHANCLRQLPGLKELAALHPVDGNIPRNLENKLQTWKQAEIWPEDIHKIWEIGISVKKALKRERREYPVNLPEIPFELTEDLAITGKETVGEKRLIRFAKIGTQLFLYFPQYPISWNGAPIAPYQEREKLNSTENRKYQDWKWESQLKHILTNNRNIVLFNNKRNKPISVAAGKEDAQTQVQTALKEFIMNLTPELTSRETAQQTGIEGMNTLALILERANPELKRFAATLAARLVSLYEQTYRFYNTNNSGTEDDWKAYLEALKVNYRTCVELGAVPEMGASWLANQI